MYFTDETLFFSSHMCWIPELNENYNIFISGHIWRSRIRIYQKYFNDILNICFKNK